MSDQTTIPTDPTKKSVPPESDRNSALNISNFADNEATAKRFIEQAKRYFDKFNTQGARQSAETNWDRADKMFRMASGTTKQDQNLTATEQDCVPHTYYNPLRMLSAFDMDVMLGDHEPPVKYVPVNDLTESSRTEMQEVMRQRNIVLEYTMEEDDMPNKFGDIVFRVNKYSNCLVTMEWIRREHDVRDRTPDGKRVTKKQIEQRPSLKWWDLKDVWFDAELDDMNSQQCIVRRWYPSYNEVVAGQRAGQYKNAGQAAKRAAELLYATEQPGDTRQNRQINAGEAASTEAETGTFDAYTIDMRAPINDAGEWDDKDTLPRWFRGTYLGHLDGAPSGMLSIELGPNPYAERDELPCALIHSHRDDKGAYHMGYVDVLWPVWNEYKTALDQWFANKDLVSAAPWITEAGAIITSDKDFGPRRLIEMAPGMMDKLQRVKVESNTQDMLMFIQYLETKVHEIAATNRAFRGEAMGSRTSAREHATAFDQSAKPALHKTRYVADQLLQFVAVWTARLWRQFAPRNAYIALGEGTQFREAKPAELYGGFKAKVVAIDRYEATTLQRMEQDRFVQTTLPLLLPTLPKHVQHKLHRRLWRDRMGFDLAEIIPETMETDAFHVAESENTDMLQGSGAFDQPKQGENHDVHIQSHKAGLAVYELNENPDQGRIRNMKAHILIHEQLRDTEGAQIQAAGQGMAGAGAGAGGEEGGLPGPNVAPAMATGLGTGATPPMDEGQAGGDMMASQSAELSPQ
ncbi:MAG: hypothetical protein ABIH03_09550 [Pseudomonadota bacterium]